VVETELKEEKDVASVVDVAEEVIEATEEAVDVETVVEEDSVVETELKEEKDVASVVDVAEEVIEATEEAVDVETVVLQVDAERMMGRAHGYPSPNSAAWLGRDSSRRLRKCTSLLYQSRNTKLWISF
jgi:hypothetical protein